jgi:hypothetical protein
MDISRGPVQWVKSKKQPGINDEAAIFLHVGPAHNDTFLGAFRRSWSRRWVGSQIIDLDS